MKHSNNLLGKGGALVVSAVLMLISLSEANAITWTNLWTDSGNKNTNWSQVSWFNSAGAGTVPGSSAADVLAFSAIGNNGTLTNDFGNVTLGGWSFRAWPGKNYALQTNANGYGFTFDNNGNGACIVNATNETVGSITINNPVVLSDNLFVTNNASSSGTIKLAGTISNGPRAAYGLTVYSPVATNGGVTLAGANTYGGPTTIAVGKLGLTGSINNSTQVVIAVGATFDVSSAGFTFTGTSPQQTLAGSGTGGLATINAPGKTITLAYGSLLSFQAAGGAGSTIGKISVAGSSANLVLNNNSAKVNATGSSLAVGNYRLLDCTGTLTGSANATPAIAGIALSGGYTAGVSTTAGVAGHVDLTVQATAQFSGLSGKAMTNGTPALSLSGIISSTSGPTVVYPANGDVVSATINGQLVIGSVTNAAGGFLINYNDPSLVLLPGGNYSITYSYAGNVAQFLAAANDASTSLTVVAGVVSVTVVLTNLTQVYDGTARSVTAITSPAGLSANVTYNGLATVPTNTGNYTVIATVNTTVGNTNYQGAATNTLHVLLPAPATLTATPTNASVLLAWSPVSGASSYKIKRSLFSGGPYSNLQNGITGTNFTDNTTSYEMTYYYVICGADGASDDNNSPEASATPISIHINSVTLSTTNLGSQVVTINLTDVLGTNDVASVALDVIGEFTNTQAYIPINPYIHSNEVAVLAQPVSITNAIWQVGMFSLQVTNLLVVKAYDQSNDVCLVSNTFLLTPRPGSYVTVAGRNIYDLVDPHSVWRDIVRNQIPATGSSVTFNGYCWRVNWQPNYFTCYGNYHAATNSVVLPPANTDTNNIWLDINGPTSVQLHAAVFVGGSEQTGNVIRHLSGTNSLFGIQPTYEVSTGNGRLVWWVQNLTGDPVLRFGATFYASNTVIFTPTYKINKNNWSPATVISNTVNSAIWFPNSNLSNFNNYGPVFSYIYSQMPTTTDIASIVDFPAVTLTAGQSYNYPMVALAQVDAGINCGDSSALAAAAQWGDTLARAALAVPRMDCVYQDIGVQSNGLYRVAINRGYNFLTNNLGLTDQGQFIALAWPIGSNVVSGLQSQIRRVHTAFGVRPALITTSTQILCDLPLPMLTDQELAPAGVGLTGDWLARATNDIAALYAVQTGDGAFPNEYNLHFLDDYFLSRLVHGLGQAYKGFGNSQVTQMQIATMMKRSYDRLMDVNLAIQTNAPNVHFGYHPQWDFYSELPWYPLNTNFPNDYAIGFYQNTDRTEAKCMVYWGLYLYGKYVDTNYVRQSLIQERVRQMIQFQWVNQDWNGDLWRNVPSGGQAAGSGDGWEEDLAIMLPKLAELANLEPDWINLAYRSAALKYGALLNFDHLSPPAANNPAGWTTNYFSYPPPATALNEAAADTGWSSNELGFISLAPMHNSGTIYWQPDSARPPWGDAWFGTGEIAGGGYGDWYTDSLLTNHIGLFDWQMYYVYEDYKDYPSTGLGIKMWMANNVYSGEARVHDPFLAAVKLLRSRQIAEANNWVPYSISMIGLSGTRPMDILWNSAWWSADFAQMQIELANRYPFMAGSISVSNAASTSDFNHGPTYAWLTPTGAVVSVAGYRIFSPTNFIITLNGTQLGLPTNGNWQFTDIATGTTNFVAAGQPLTVTVSPHSATTLRYSGPMVTGLSATPSNGMASLIWSPVNGATNYYVKRANVSGGPYTVIKSNLIATTYADINVANGTTYYYVVSGVAGGIQTANSFEAGATPNITTGSVSIKVTSISLGIGGAIQLGGTGDVGQAYVLQATTNLVPPVVWLSLLTNNADINGIFNFTDQQAANFSSRYYRITNH